MNNMAQTTEASAPSAATSRSERSASMNSRANMLADRIEQGAAGLATFAQGLSDAEWNTVVPVDGRTVGVLVHHVGNMYPIEIELVQVLASNKPVEGVTWAMVAGINAEHAQKFAACTKAEALALLAQNSKMAATAVRALTDEQLDRANKVSLNADAPLTAQYFIEEHPLRHSWHHLAKMKTAINK
jgi:hypothetical protein